MKIEFENTFKDIFIFSISQQFSNKVLQIMLVLLCMMIFFAEAGRNIEDMVESPYLSAIIPAMFWYLFLWLIQVVFLVLHLQTKKSKSVLTKHIVEIQPDALLEETEFNRSYFYWKGIFKVLTTSRFITIYVTPCMAVIIPNRAFASSDQKNEFHSELLKRFNGI